MDKLYIVAIPIRGWSDDRRPFICMDWADWQESDALNITKAANADGFTLRRSDDVVSVMTDIGMEPVDMDELIREWNEYTVMATIHG